MVFPSIFMCCSSMLIPMTAGLAPFLQTKEPKTRRNAAVYQVVIDVDPFW